MRTLQEKYNAIQEGKFSKDQFLVEARMQQPQLVTRYNGYKDAVQILKNRGMIKESSAEESFADYSNDALNDMMINMSRYEGNEDEIARVKSELQRRKETVNEASYKVSKNSKQAQHLKKGDIITSGDEIISVSAGAKTPAGKVEVTMKTKNGSTKTSIWGKTTMIGVKPVNEAKLTKKSLTDYRYKPTNDMDKYPYEQILRGLRVELEVMQVYGTPTADEYKKALAKVLKNLEKDEIFYTNQLAGHNKKVDLHDKFVDATAKNTVDTFNGMKKIKDLKENTSPLNNLPDGKYFAIDGDWDEEYKGHNGLFFTLKGPNLIGSDGQNFQTSPEEFLSQFTPDEIIRVEESSIKEDHSKNPDDKYAVRPCKNKKEPWAVWEGEKRVKGFATKEQAKEYADKQNKKQGLSESVLKEGIKNLIKKALMENEEDIYEMQGPKTDGEYKSELADYLEDNQIYGYTDMIHDIMTGPDEEENSASLTDFLDDHQIYGYNKAIERMYSDYPYDEHWMNQPDEDEADDISHPRGYEEASDEEDFDDLMEEYTPGQTVTFTNTNDGNKYTGTVVKDLGNGRFTFRAEDGKVYGSEGFGRNWKIKFEADGEAMFESVSLKDLLD